MIDRQKLETILQRRFAGAGFDQIASAANAIMGLDDDWEEVASCDDFGYKVADECCDACWLSRQAQIGTQFRFLRRRQNVPQASARMGA